MNLFIIKLVIICTLFGIAAYQDYKDRLVSDYIWIATAILCLPIQLYELFVLNTPPLQIYLIEELLFILFFLAMYYIKLFAEADLIAFIVLTIFIPIIPEGPLTKFFSIYAVPGLFVLSIIVLGLILGIIVYIPINYLHNMGMLKKYGIKQEFSMLEKIRFLFMVLVPKESIDNLKYLPGLKIVCNHQEGKEDKNLIPLSDEHEQLVWASMGVPVITFLFISILIHLILTLAGYVL